MDSETPKKLSTFRFNTNESDSSPQREGLIFIENAFIVSFEAFAVKIPTVKHGRLNDRLIRMN